MAEQASAQAWRQDGLPFPDTFLDGNRLMSAALGVHFLICGVVALATKTWLLWLAVGLPSVLFPIWLASLRPTALLTRLVFSAGAVTFTLLAVEQTGGYMEAHFSFFVMITFAAVYRDWRPLIFAAALVIIHHVIFSILDPQTVGFYEPNNPLGAYRHVFSHLSVGLIQVFTLCYLTTLLRRRDAQNAELGYSLDRATERAERDHLTGLYNRNHLEHVVERLSPQVQSGHMQTVICLLDLDHFKKVNDGFGHTAGDEVLRVVTETIRGQLRTSDSAFRQGGEEFLVILPSSDIEDGFHFAERVRNRIASEPVFAANETIAITISIGLASWQGAQTFDESMERADQALYESKKLGRNRVEVWSESAPIASREDAPRVLESVVAM